jgi:hypothetical protein
MNDLIVGSHASCFPFFGNKSGGLNIVSGVEAVADSIFYILLLQKGEDPCYPDLGMSPQLFTTPSSVDAFRDEAQKALETGNKKAKIGFNQVSVETTTIDGIPSLKVTFTVGYSDESHVLTFRYWKLINCTKNAQGFMDTIQLS